jgi:hypothetical protein
MLTIILALTLTQDAGIVDRSTVAEIKPGPGLADVDAGVLLELVSAFGKLASPTSSSALADAGVLAPTFSEPLYATCPEAPPAEKVTNDTWLRPPAGSYILSPKRAARNACLMETCDVDRQKKEQLLDGSSAPNWAVQFGIGVATGIAAGFTIGRLVK